MAKNNHQVFCALEATASDTVDERLAILKKTTYTPLVLTIDEIDIVET